MEKEYLGEVKSWKEIEKKAKELLEEGKIDAVEFISEKSWKANSENIYIFTRLRDKKQLKELFDVEKPYYSNIKKYDLYIVNTFPLGVNNILVVLYTRF